MFSGPGREHGVLTGLGEGGYGGSSEPRARVSELAEAAGISVAVGLRAGEDKGSSGDEARPRGPSRLIGHALRATPA